MVSAVRSWVRRRWLERVRAPQAVVPEVRVGLLVFAATVIMLVGMLGMPSEFYTVLRVVVCLSAVVGFVSAKGAGLERWRWVYGVMAVVYNPIAPVYLHSRGMWMIVNLVAIALLWNGLRATRRSATEVR